MCAPPSEQYERCPARRTRKNCLARSDLQRALLAEHACQDPCASQEGFYGDAGAYVLLVNLDNLQAMPNPTEPGSRAWFFMTAGGEAYQFNKSPLPLESTRLCDAEPLTDYRISRSVTMLGVVIPPGESAAVVAAEDEHAGAYTFENVNWTDIGHAGGDATDEINIRLVRAD